MTYRGRLTDAVQRELWRHGLSESQVQGVYVNEVDVSPRTSDAYLAVDCSVPLAPVVTGSAQPAQPEKSEKDTKLDKSTVIIDPPQVGDAVLKVRVLLDERTTLRILLNSLLDETSVPHGSRRTQREITDEINQAVYARLRRLAAPRTGPASDAHHEDDKS